MLPYNTGYFWNYHFYIYRAKVKWITEYKSATVKNPVCSVMIYRSAIPAPSWAFYRINATVKFKVCLTPLTSKANSEAVKDSEGPSLPTLTCHQGFCGLVCVLSLGIRTWRCLPHGIPECSVGWMYALLICLLVVGCLGGCCFVAVLDNLAFECWIPCVHVLISLGFLYLGEELVAHMLTLWLYVRNYSSPSQGSW